MVGCTLNPTCAWKRAAQHPHRMAACSSCSPCLLPAQLLGVPG